MGATVVMAAAVVPAVSFKVAAEAAYSPACVLILLQSMQPVAHQEALQVDPLVVPTPFSTVVHQVVLPLAALLLVVGSSVVSRPALLHVAPHRHTEVAGAMLRRTPVAAQVPAEAAVVTTVQLAPRTP